MYQYQGYSEQKNRHQVPVRICGYGRPGFPKVNTVKLCFLGCNLNLHQFIYISEYFTLIFVTHHHFYRPLSALTSHQFSSDLRRALPNSTQITMNISASQQLDQPIKSLSLKQTGEDIKVITNWLMVRDTNGELWNLLLYSKRNKAEAARQLGSCLLIPKQGRISWE